MQLHNVSALLAALWLVCSASAVEPDARGVEFFEKKIRPVLIEHCYQCHSATAVQVKKLRGGLLLDSREGLHKGGDSGPVLKPGKPAESLLIQALRQQTFKMPPKGKLPDPVIADFVQWVEMGAPDPRDGSPLTAKRVIDLDAGRRHWAFTPLAPVAPPAIKKQDWPHTPIDQFILAKLEEKGLSPNPSVNQDRLLRRAYFDLVGLPPTPQEAEAFLKDSAPGAYERLIDRLLSSERYGERWARHWLDVVRFAESGGYEFDGDRPGAHHFRDFVIKALNQDMPFDQFVRLQIAGDQLLPGDFLAASATGFLVAGPYPGQMTAKTAELIRYDHLDDMVATLGTSLLGLSTGCARCHEHKYDPIPQQDYYHLLSCLSRTDSVQAKLDPHPDVYRQAKAAFDKAHAPLLAARDKFEKDELPGRLQKWLALEKDKPAPAWLTIDPIPTGAAVPPKPSGKAPTSESHTYTVYTHQKGITAIRLETVPDESPPKAGAPPAPKGNLSLTEFSVTAAPLTTTAKPAPVVLQAGAATFKLPQIAPGAALTIDKKNAWLLSDSAAKHGVVFETKIPLGFDGGTVLTIKLTLESTVPITANTRLALATGKPATLDGSAAVQNAWELLTVLKEQQGQVNAKNRDEAFRLFRKFDPGTEQVQAAVEVHARQEPQPNLIPVFVATSGRGGDVHYLIRGEVERKNGVAPPGFLQVLMNTPEREKRWLGAAPVNGKPSPPTEPRIALAKWITDPDTGAARLLARVIVNRLWQHHLGKGLVRTPNDFGVQGEPPTHPELLDWLAGELIRNGWKLKPIQKLIVTSAVYREGGERNPTAQAVDPQNRLWWRVPPRRLEAESIRDALLAVGGTLDPAMFGPGTLDENSLRRSVYLTVKRSRLIPLMQAFDSPEPIQGIGERSTTTAATQALAMLNSPLVRRQAEKLAQRVRPKTPDALPQAVEDAYLIALARHPTVAERERMLGFIRHAATPAPASLDGALVDFCQVLLCLNEFIYVD